MSERQQRLKGLLDKMVAEPGMAGAALVSRDGISVLSSFRRSIHPETFSAMSATLMGAAEVALSELGGARMRRVLAEADNLRMVSLGVSGEIILVVLAEADVPVERLLKLSDEAASHAKDALRG